jgi:hypothetical protein
MPKFWLELDSALRERLHSVLEDPERRVTEAELRRLAEEGNAFSRILRAELERFERRLAERDSDPASSLGAIADAFRRVHDLRAHVDELDALLTALDDRARDVRASRVLHSDTARGRS